MLSAKRLKNRTAGYRVLCSVKPFAYILHSSAWNIYLDLLCRLRFAIYVKNKRGPRTEPCGPPLVLMTGVSWRSPKKFYLLEMLWVTIKVVPERPHNPFCKSLSCETLSNAFAKAKYTMSTELPISCDNDMCFA